MDIRCGSCNKLFRVADDKISGKGIRFKCSRCGEVITVTRDEVAALQTPAAEPEAPAAPPAPAPPDTPPPSLAETREETAPAGQEYQPHEYQPPAPSAGLDDFDFSEPSAAAAAMGGQEAAASGDSFSFDAPAETSSSEGEPGGEISISEDEEKAAETAFQFPADIISEPARKPVFASDAAAPTDEAAPSGETAGEEQKVPDLTMDEPAAAGPAKAEREPAPAARETPAEPAPPARPAISQPARPAAAPRAAAQDDDIDLGQALAIPRSVPEQEEPKPASGPEEDEGTTPSPEKASRGQAGTDDIHPLAAGNATGAIAGLGCALPLVLLALFAFSILVQFVPQFSAFPRFHLLAVMGTGVFGLAVMTGTIVSLVQAQAGKKLFFLLNVVIGAAFGMVYGAGMDTVTSLASGQGLSLAGMVSAALSGGTLGLLLSLLIVLARRILLFSREETFAAPLSGLQKAGLGISLAVILVSLYAEGTLIGSMEKAAQEIQQQFAADITPDGLSVQNSSGYVDDKTGDLIISGTVQNGLDAPKPAWYLEVDVFDQQQKVLATVRMLNGVQLFDDKELEVLAAREKKNVDEMKAAMLLAFQGGTIPPKGGVDFEVRLLSPPPGITSFYPQLRKFERSEASTAK